MLIRLARFSSWFLLAVILGTRLGGARGAAGESPNFIIFLVDDLGWSDVGCYGSRFYQTPAIDRLASEGMRFTDAYAAAPVCSPTRASLLTGKYPARLHLTDWLPGRQDRPSQRLLKPDIVLQLPLEEMTLPEALKPLGYTSASIGKWHLGGKGYGPEEQGFDLNVAGDSAGSPISYFAPFRRGPFVMPGLESAPPGQYLTDRLTDEAEKFIRANRSRPFFLYLSHYAVHIPLHAKEALMAKYRTHPGSGPQTNIIYAAMIESVDESLARIMATLDDLHLTERTVVLFTSDNGGLSVKEGPNTPATSNHPLRDGKGYLHEGGIRVPFIVRWPGVIPAGTLAHTPVSSIDLFPTLLDLAGTKPSKPVDGVSLVPLLKQTGTLSREALFWHYPHYSNQGGKPGGAVRVGGEKLIQSYEDGHLELYDLRNDPGEAHNLVWQQPARARTLEKLLEDWRLAQNAQMMEPNPDYSPSTGALAEPKKSVFK